MVVCFRSKVFASKSLSGISKMKAIAGPVVSPSVYVDRSCHSSWMQPKVHVPSFYGEKHKLWKTQSCMRIFTPYRKGRTNRESSRNREERRLGSCKRYGRRERRVAFEEENTTTCRKDVGYPHALNFLSLSAVRLKTTLLTGPPPKNRELELVKQRLHVAYTCSLLCSLQKQSITESLLRLRNATTYCWCTSTRPGILLDHSWTPGRFFNRLQSTPGMALDNHTH